MARAGRHRYFTKGEEATIRRQAIVGLRVEDGWTPVAWKEGPGGGPGGYVEVPADEATRIRCPGCGGIIKWNQSAAAFRHKHNIGSRVTDEHRAKHTREVWRAAAERAAIAKHGPIKVEV